MLIIGILVFGMAIGALVQLAQGRSSTRIDWGMALVAGLVGSFVGGLLISLLAGDGLAFRPSGVIGSIVGATIVTFAWMKFDAVKAAEAQQAQRR
jgi:uncharacterized membrane protein YeaQ/YmgE (transglycosylase-associated protein family)